jgi:hypothetical protein
MYRYVNISTLYIEDSNLYQCVKYNVAHLTY